MHGWTMTAGDFFQSSQNDIVNMLDNMIEKGDIPPVIVVCVTFDASVFHRDLRDNLIPAIESQFHTYALDVTEEGIQASRNHRAFGGFF